jgi:hypothetical protein
VARRLRSDSRLPPSLHLHATSKKFFDDNVLPKPHHKPRICHRQLQIAIAAGYGNDRPHTVHNPVAIPNCRELCLRSQCQPYPQQPRARSRGPEQRSSSSQQLPLHMPAITGIPALPMMPKSSTAPASIEATQYTAAEDEIPVRMRMTIVPYS